MASVRMTQDLRDNIFNNAMAAFNAAKPKPKPTTWLTDRVKDAIENSPPYLTLKRSAELKNTNQFDSFGGLKENADRKQVPEIRLVFRSNELSPNDVKQIDFEFVPHMTIYSQNYWGVPVMYFSELAPQSKVDLMQPLLAFAAEVQEYVTQHKTYVEKIQGLLSNCTTIKQFLLAWPGGESFVPHHAKSRMYTRVSRAEKAKQIVETVQFDDAFVNEVVLTAKLVGA